MLRVLRSSVKSWLGFQRSEDLIWASICNGFVEKFSESFLRCMNIKNEEVRVLSKGLLRFEHLEYLKLDLSRDLLLKKGNEFIWLGALILIHEH